MRGTVVSIVIGMFVAAIVGVAAVFAVQAMAPEKDEEHQAPDVGDMVATAVKNELGSFESAVQEQLNGLTVSVNTLNAQVSRLEQKLGELRVSASPAKAGGIEQSPGGKKLEDVITKALDESERRRAEQRTQERAQRMERMQERFKSMMVSRVEQFAEGKDWDIAKSEQVKQILSESMEKAGELFRLIGRGGGPPSPETFEQIQQIMDEARAELLEIMSEEEVDKLLESMPGPPGRFRGGRRGGGGQGQQPDGSTPHGR